MSAQDVPVPSHCPPRLLHCVCKIDASHGFLAARTNLPDGWLNRRDRDKTTRENNDESNGTGLVHGKFLSGLAAAFFLRNQEWSDSRIRLIITDGRRPLQSSIDGEQKKIARVKMKARQSTPSVRLYLDERLSMIDIARAFAALRSAPGRDSLEMV
ncbi:MAG: hypothetical protein IPK83_12935 [Planctomycetes bacterium]|nr:hypothetical protein [Planctomycetota bacterium]